MRSSSSSWILSLLAGVLCLAAGLGAGLALAWVIAPMEQQGSSIEFLDRNSQDEYLRMAVDSFTANGDAVLAGQRFVRLGAAADAAMTRLIENPGVQGEAAIRAFEQAARSTAPSSLVARIEAVSGQGNPGLVFVILGAGAVLGLFVYVILQLTATKGPASRAPAGSSRLPQKTQQPHHRANWPLFLGASIVVLLLLLAWKGPDWAPRDPMEENYTLAVNGQIVRPPYPALTVEGFPLGTDQFGRDIFSRILWGIRPTLMMVGVVAAVRLVLGIVLGLTIGWAGGLTGRFLDWILSLALAIPVLFVALMGITALGIQTGLSVFIVGLSLTGWAETARLVSDQTRITRNQTYVEAARALGASDLRIMFSHILRQIMPLVWMLMAFEVSATLMITAELGFLGYYIGGGTWIEITDFVTVNTTGVPELGQMLATSLLTLVKPWPLIIVGSVIFLAIMGFNLLGEGLRLRVNRQMVVGGRKAFFLRGAFGEWVENVLSPTMTDWLEAHTRQLVWGAFILLLLFGWNAWYRSRPVQTSAVDQQRLAVPGNHLWASERHDAQGTRWAPVTGPQKAEILWEAIGSGGLTGGPVVAGDGTVIFSGRDKDLYAYSPEGELVWQVALTSEPVGGPALGAQGEIYVVDLDGGLTAFDPSGKTLWHFTPTRGREATSGPVVAADGVIYYTRIDNIQAVSPDGTELWLAFAKDLYIDQAPYLSAGGSFIFLKNAALAANSGAPLALDGIPQNEPDFNTPTFFVGADGRSFYRSAHAVAAWRSTESGVEMDPAVSWEFTNQVQATPSDQGTTPSGLVWLFYTSSYEDTRVIWLDASGKIAGNIRIAERDGRVIGVDASDTLYICHSNFAVNLTCTAVAPGVQQPLWEVALPQGGMVMGGALVDGRIYVASGAGTLSAVGEK